MSLCGRTKSADMEAEIGNLTRSLTDHVLWRGYGGGYSLSDGS